MEQFTNILHDATKQVTTAYFLLPVHGQSSIYRERVYCYELYHHMRTLWPPGSPYLLNGEIDKLGHPYFATRRAPKPDLLVHQPGTSRNYCAIEVKPCVAQRNGIKKDFETLEKLTNRIGYQRAIYLFYGKAEGDLLERIAPHISTERAHIEIWLHAEAGRPAFRLNVAR